MKNAIKAGLNKGLLEYLLAHDEHGGKIAWNIKTHRAEVRKLPENLYIENNLDHYWDEKWEEYLDEHDELFGNCCEDGLGFVGSNKNRQWDWRDYQDYDLYQAGRSGGWLELSRFEGQKVSLLVLEEYYEDLCNGVSSDFEDFDELVESVDHAWLDKLVEFCKSLDTFNASRELEHQYASRRAFMEEEWNNEEHPLKRELRKIG